MFVVHVGIMVSVLFMCETRCAEKQAGELAMNSYACKHADPRIRPFSSSRTFACVYRDQSFLVTSHGVGSSGASICFEELIANGAEIIVRVGTAGSLQPGRVEPGDIVVCDSAVREDGASRLLVPEGFPAVADPYVFQTLKEIAEAKKAKNVKYGMTLTSSQYYALVSIYSWSWWINTCFVILEME